MKRLPRLLACAAAAALAASAASAQIERSGRGRGSSRGSSHGGDRGGRQGGGPISRQRGPAPSAEPRPEPSGRSYAPSVIIKQRRVEVPAQRPKPFDRQESIIRESPRANPPRTDERGRAIIQPRALRPPPQHAAVVRNPAVVRDIRREQRVEVTPNRYYWHHEHGVRWAHYYDGYHWYGFYHGPRFYWCRYWNDRWWWHDPTFGRWVFWWDGFWWWPGPHGAFYVYVDNSYYPYEEGEVYVKQPEVEAPPVSAPAAPTQGSAYVSPDGKREVQVYGRRSEAFLYDKTTSSPAFLTFLGANVKDVRFSGGTGGRPERILLDFKDGSFALYDEDGKPLDERGPEAKTTATLPAAPPPAVPQPPSGETRPAGAGETPPAPPEE